MCDISDLIMFQSVSVCTVYAATVDREMDHAHVMMLTRASGVMNVSNM